MAPRRAQVQQVPVGSLYGVPGFTERFEQYDNISSWPTVGSAAAQTPFNPPSPFQKTDIIFWWEMENFASWAETYSVGTLALSPLAPYNIIQGPKLKLQGQYTPIECDSGSDMAFFQQYRPMRGRGQRNVQDLMDTFLATVGANANYQQANLAGATLSQTLTSPYSVSNYPFTLEWPAGIFMDEYWELARNGQVLPGPDGRIAPRAMFVSPQYMSGGERNIQPQFNLAAGISGSQDQGPLVATAALTATVQTISMTSSFRRVGVYSSDNPAELPPISGWQYRRASKRTTIGAVSKVDLPIPEYGQVLSVWVKVFDPALNSGTGGLYNVANITKCQLMKGSNLPRFDDDIPTMQNRFIEQHGFLPPQGHTAWDLAATGFNDNLSNARALNTLTNSNAHIHLEMTAPGAATYAVVGTELLVPVSAQ